jgi:thiol:disulfide interchange protein
VEKAWAGEDADVIKQMREMRQSRLWARSRTIIGRAKLLLCPDFCDGERSDASARTAKTSLALIFVRSRRRGSAALPKRPVGGCGRCLLLPGFWFLILACFAYLFPATPAFAGAAQRSPFGIQVIPKPGTNSQTVEVKFLVPADCVLYSERLHFLTGDDDELTPTKVPEPITELDKVSGKQKKVYERNFNVELAMASLVSNRLMVKFQGCSNDSCFFPEKRTFVFNGDHAAKMFFELTPAAPVEVTPANSDWARELNGFRVAARQSGYLPTKSFLSFLDRAQSGQENENDPLARFKKYGSLVTLALIVFFGFLLNLTPCVLPMIPINLAIIGAGSAASSRLAGFKNGGIYGIGMALAYGSLGLAVVLAGAKFGSINSSIWFNVVIAIVFVLLGLAMFDKINIDFSRFSGSLGPQNSHAHRGALVHHAVIFIMGVMAALLAGACVAPIVISVMLLAANLYAKKNLAGLLLPFLLGAGMALPWPFAGAGLTFLPKPGVWMNRVKHVFGILIFAFAIYYAHIAVAAFQERQAATSLASAPTGTISKQTDANLELAQALEKARKEGRPVLVDFHASWCKNCLAMDETVFPKTEVKQRLQDFILVRYDAERPGEAPAKEVLDHFGVLGLPSYIVLTENKNPTQRTP